MGQSRDRSRRPSRSDVESPRRSRSRDRAIRGRDDRYDHRGNMKGFGSSRREDMSSRQIYDKIGRRDDYRRDNRRYDDRRQDRRARDSRDRRQGQRRGAAPYGNNNQNNHSSGYYGRKGRDRGEDLGRLREGEDNHRSVTKRRYADAPYYSEGGHNSKDFQRTPRQVYGSEKDTRNLSRDYRRGRDPSKDDRRHRNYQNYERERDSSSNLRKMSSKPDTRSEEDRDRSRECPGPLDKLTKSTRQKSSSSSEPEQSKDSNEFSVPRDAMVAHPDDLFDDLDVEEPSEAVVAGEPRHFQWKKGAEIGTKHRSFVIDRKLGDGTFGRVLRCSFQGESKRKDNPDIWAPNLEHDEDERLKATPWKDRKEVDALANSSELPAGPKADGSERRYAVKLIRDNDRYRADAEIEYGILCKVRREAKRLKFRNGSDRIVKLYEGFVHVTPNKDEHLCMVFEVLGSSLFDLLKNNNWLPYHLGDIQAFANDGFQALAFLMEMGLTHTDLKPENILLQYGGFNLIKNPNFSPYEKFEAYYKKWGWDPEANDGKGGPKNKNAPPAPIITTQYIMPQNALDTLMEHVPYKSFSVDPSGASPASGAYPWDPYAGDREDHPLYTSYMRPRSARIKLIDFGGATFEKEYHSCVISTRQYRSPEVLLDVTEKWNEKTDVWSLATILMELHTGGLLFEAHSNVEQLKAIETILGPFPPSIICRSSAQLLSEYFLAYPKEKSTEGAPRHRLRTQEELDHDAGRYKVQIDQFGHREKGDRKAEDYKHKDKDNGFRSKIEMKQNDQIAECNSKWTFQVDWRYKVLYNDYKSNEEQRGGLDDEMVNTKFKEKLNQENLDQMFRGPTAGFSSFIKKALTINDKERPSARQMLEHPWLTEKLVDDTQTH